MFRFRYIMRALRVITRSGGAANYRLRYR